jgi:asparagine synthetase B (glutamine-hydrolysing)
MSGIAGMHNFPCGKPLVRCMATAIANQGSDTESISLDESPRPSEMPRHCRISTIDLSRDTSKIFNRRDLVFTRNGEVFNYHEPNQELEAEDTYLKLTSDTEILPATWANSGTNITFPIEENVCVFVARL